MKELEMNPYVIQIDKFVSSMNKLSEVFLNLEKKQGIFTESEIQNMCGRVCELTCKNCARECVCLGKDLRKTHELAWEIFRGIENCGVELNIEVKRKVKNYCAQAEKYIQNAVELYKEEKQKLVWSQRIVQNREGCAVQLGSFAQMIQHATHELNSSIFADDFLEKKIKNQFSKLGVKILTTVFFVTEEGRYEIHLTMKASKGKNVPTKQLAKVLSDCCGRNMVLGENECFMLSSEYTTIICVESQKYYTMSGVARIGKGCRKISGDSFSMIELAGKKQGVILSDGMGAGESARRESTMVVELLEELLEAGFLKNTAIQMLNTTLVTGREEVRFSTVDMCVFDLYSGKCSFTKAGAAPSFIKEAGGVTCIKSASLPVGVVSNLEIDETEKELKEGDYVIMVTDGIMDALPVGEQELLLKMMIEGNPRTNPKEMAEYLLGQVLECSGEIPMDDMTILVVGLCSLEK